MKGKLLTLAACSSLFFSTSILSGCSSCGSGFGLNFGTGCGPGGCGGYQANCAISCCPYDTPCQCTDPGWQWNNCIDKCTYCQAFGNIGAR